MTADHLVTALYPLSTPQREIWFDQMLHDGVPLYNIGGYVDLPGRIDPEIFEQAVNLLVRRHDSLRLWLTAERDGDGLPLQAFVDPWPVRVPLVDLSGEADPEAAAQSFMRQRFKEPFSLEGQPLFRYDLVKLADDHYYWLLQYHHLSIDGWGVALLNRSLAALYSDLAAGRAPALESPSYGAYVADDRAYVESAKFEQQRVFWRNHHPEPPEPLLTPFYRRKFGGALAGSGCESMTLPRAFYDRLGTLAESLGVSRFHVLLGALYVYFARTGQCDEVTVGLPVLNRANGAYKQTAGLFTNHSPVRFACGRDLSFANLLERISATLKAVYRHQRFPSSEICRAAGAEAGRARLSDVGLSYESHDYDAVFAEIATHFTALLHPWEQMPLQLFVRDFHAEQDIRVDFVYNQAYFTAGEIRALHERFRMVLETALSDPHRSIASWSILPEAERQQVLVEWNATEADYPKDQCIHQLFEAQAERTPEAIALVFEEQSLTYAQLNARANQLAHHLIHLGIRPDDRVAIGVERSLEMVVGLLAILKAGGAYVPLDPAYPEERLKFMLEDSAPVALLVHGATRERFAALAHGVPLVDLDADAAAWREWSDSNPEPAALGLKTNHLAYVIYTSGSTGKPKGVMVEHQAIVGHCNTIAEHYQLHCHDRVLQFASLSFDTALEQIIAALITGATLMLRDSELWSVDDFHQKLIELELTVVDLSPSYLHQWLYWQQQKPQDYPFPPHLRLLISGGDVLQQDSVQLWRQLCEQYPLLDTVRLLNAYGPTESTITATTFDFAQSLSTDNASPRVPIGRALPNRMIYILGGQGDPAPIAVPGELHIGGASLARGYLDNPELTAEKFIANPFGPGRLYKTGDLARYLPNGNIEYLGRIDFQVKIRGFRIELGEIEAALRGCDGIREAVVLAREDAPGEKRLVAYVTVAGSAKVAGGIAVADGVDVADKVNLAMLPATLKTHLRSSLPDYMLPAAFVVLEALPLTPNGKLDRKALPAPEADAYATGAYAPPVGSVEEVLAELWSELLGIERVGRHDDFFSLGGHSLLAVSLVERMRRQGLPVDVRALFTTPTLAELASVVGDGAELAVPPNRIPPDCTRLTPDLLPLVSLEQAAIDRIVATVPGGAANVQDIYPLGPLQEGLLFHHLLQGEGDAYVLAALYGFDSRARLQGFLLAFDAVIARHDIFRTAFAWEGLPEPVQVVWRNAPLPIEEVAFGPQVVDVSAALLERFDPRRHRLDLRLAPLFHAAIAEDQAQGRWLLLLRDHHLVADHTTLEVLFEEITAYQSDRFEALPTPLPYRNYIAQARLGLSAEAHAAFFQELLAAVDEPTAPFGHLEVRGDGTGIEESRRRLEPSLAARLRQQARRLGVTPASLFHLAFARVLAATSGRSDVVFGTVLFGRLKGGEGAERMPGLFINTLPVRIEAGDEGVEAAVRRTHRTLAGLLRHEHAPLALAQRCSGVLAPAPLFSALLNYRHSPEESEGAVAAMWEGIELLQAEERTNYPLGVSVDDLGQGFSLTAQTLPSVGAERLCGYLETATKSLVAALESAPATRVREVAVLPEAERQQVLVEWNATEADYPKDQCVHQLFEAQVEQTPDAVALIFEEQSLTYAELNARANQLAHHLVHLGIRPDDRVAIGVERSLEMVVGLLAILKAGGAYVPLDPAYPEERLAIMLEDSAPMALLVHGATREQFAALAHGVPLVDLDGDAVAWAERSASNPEPDALDLRPNHLAYVIYTSGSTGKPKGVMVEHQGVSNLVAAQIREFGLATDSRVLQFASVSFDACVSELFTALCSGALLHLPPTKTKLVGEALASTIARHGLSHATLPPSVLATLPDGERLSTLGTLTVAGERLPKELARRWAADRSLINAYGPTEATVCATLHLCAADASADPSIGRPIANTQIYLLDGNGQPVPVGIAGEIHIGGAGVARGYLNRPNLTAERFLPDPYAAEPDARMYRTGDLARWLPDGNLEYIGRADFQVKIRGFRIELGEIEAALRGCDGIREAVVLAREDVAGEKRLVAYVTVAGSVKVAGGIAVADGADVADDVDIAALPAELKAQLRSSLPDYMLPAAFVVLEALPLTPNGKLDRKALPAPEADAYATGAYEPPVGPVEEDLAALWSELLGIDRIGRHDDFFALGGHSLLAVQVISRLRSALGLEVSLAELFARPVLAEFAAALVGAGAADGGLIPLADRSQPLPLSFAQRRLWFLAQLEGPSATYNIPLAWRLAGELDHQALRGALNQLVGRHEALRTSFVAVDGEPIQRIVPATDTSFALFEHDLRQTHDAEAELAQWLEKEAAEPFDLEAGPLLRGRLLQLADREHALLLTMHHAIADGWSLGVLGRELGALYRAMRQGEADPLPPLPIQYPDYAVWERQWVAEERLQRQAAYWQSALAGAPLLLELPTDHPRPPVQDYVGAMLPLVIDAELTGKLKALARRHGATLFQVLLAGFAALLSRLSGQTEVVIGSPSAHRSRTELEGLIGFFVNTLALRIDTASSSVAELIARAKGQTLAAQAHEDLPFEQVVELLQPPRSLAHAPLFQVMFAWQNTPEAAFVLPGLTAEALAAPYGVAKFDLTLSLAETGERIEGGLEYATALFDPTTVQRWVGHLQTLLRALADVSADTEVGKLPLLSEAERQQVLVEWNATEADYPKDQCIHQLFEAQAERSPEAIALVFEQQSLTYSQLNTRANQLAHHLIALGIRPDDRVAIGVERSLEMVVGLLAILKAGGAYVPLDPAYPEERLNFMLEDSAPIALLVHGATREQFAALAKGVPLVDLDGDAVAWAELISTKVDPAALGLRPNHLAYVIYTSGSTGKPKGVTMPHRAVSNLVAWQLAEHGFARPARTLQFSPISFDVSFQEIFSTLCTGGALILIGDESRRNSDALLQSLELDQVERLFLPFVALDALATASQGQWPSSLREVVTAGEQLHITDALAACFENGRCGLHNHYGPTETHVATAFRLPVDVSAWPSLPPIGRPIANTRTYVLDGDGQPVPIGVAGELHIGGAGVARGYLNRPELTAERFLPDPYASEPDARMYRTGDLARWLPDGNLEYIGRADFQVKIRGFRIELGEIEAALRCCQGVREAVVLAREDSPGEKRLVAYVTVDTAADNVDTTAVAADIAALPAELKAQLRSSLPDYMLPAAFVVLEALPLTPNGKLDRKALPAPEADAYATGAYEPPVGPVEEDLAELWSELLGIDRIGRHDDFFALGGHSLLAVQVISRLRSALGLEVSLAELFARPVLAEFAAALVGAGAADGGLIPLADRSQPLPLSFAQRRLWFLAQLEGPSATYNMPLAWRLAGELDHQALRGALNQLVGRHEALRTTFVAVDGEPMQRIVPATDTSFALCEHDLRQTHDAEAELAHWLEKEAAEPFDLEAGPLLRGRLLQLADREHALLLTMHHAIADGWSLGVLGRELGALYGAIRQGEADPLPPLPIQYPDYAVWERQWVAEERLQLQAAYWQSALAGAPLLLELPTDHPRPPVQDYVGAVLPLVIDAELTGKLKALARRHGATLFQVLLAGFAALLSRLSGQTEVVIGSPSAHRSRTELEGLIGFFVNTLALRIDTASSSVAELIARAKGQTLAAQAHEDLPFEQVVELLQPPRSLAHAPLFQVMFAWQNTPEASLGLQGLTAEALAALYGVAKFDLTLSLAETGEQIEGGLEYATALFDPATMQRWVGHLQTLLIALADGSADTEVGKLPLLSEAERQQVLVEWNATEADYPKDQCIHQLFEAQAERSPEAIALVFEQQSLTYAELNASANQLAHHLVHLGIRPDDRVAIGVERSLEMVVGLLAILKAGGAYVPLDPAYPEERLKFMLEDSKPVALLMHGDTRERFAALAVDVPLVDLDGEAMAWAELSATNPEPDSLDLRPNHLAYVIYTSGSTGMPKGVMVEHCHAVNLIEWARREFPVEDLRRTLFATSINFDLAVFECFVPLSVGGASVIVRNVIDAGTALAELTLINTVPSAMDTLLRSGALPSNVRAVNLAGEPLRRDLAEVIFRGSQVDHLRNLYGPSETTTYSSWVTMRRDEGFAPHIGRPIANTRIYLLDGNGQPVPIGVAGELHIGGAGVARGYLNRPELTAERFLPDPYASEPDARMYRTGDLARWLPDGNLEYLGRVDFQVKIRGFRIELGEIEAALRGCQGVREAVVLAREDSLGEKLLVAYVTADTAADNVDTTAVAADIAALPAELKAQLRGSLPDYMLPAAFVVLEALPLTPNGKLDRKALPAPEADAYATGAYEPPVGSVEEALAALWSELLGIDRIGRHDDFFSLGGHSLLAIRLISEIDQAFGVRLSVGAVFLRPTLSELSEAVSDSRLAEEAAALVPLRPEGIDPPLFLLPGAIGSVLYLQPLAEALGEGRPVLALPTPGLDGRPTLESLTELAAHHLRTLRRWQPRGPYLLAGHSSGGRVAFEMAQQLERQGETVARLVILDTNAPDPDQDQPNRTERELLADLVEVFEELGGVALGISREAILSEPNTEDAYAKVMIAFQVNGVLFSRGAAVAELKALAAVYRSALITHQGLRIAERLRAPIHLLRARDRGGSEASVDQRPAWGWAEGTEQEVVVDEVPGTHITMMAPPHVAVLAERLGAILAAACGGAESGITTPAKAVAVAEAVV